MIVQAQTTTGNIQKELTKKKKKKELTESGEEISGGELADPSYIPEELTD